ncbi:MAG: thioredoxin domain-containing protein, partial [Pyrinomonadaceae bacterium]|nr:thioredoxin domain-containing protein [Pyrinomonadaceae bacterium]
MKKLLPLVIIGGVLIVALGGAAMLLKSPSSSSPANSSFASPTPGAAQATASARQPAVVAADEKPVHVRGRADAPVLVEEFGDFQCPPCGQFHPIMSRIERDFPTQVRFSFRHFPIKTQHPHAVLAAHATEAAGLQGKFWELHDVIYEKQAEWKDAKDARPIFTNYARALGLDMQKFAQDIDSTPASMRLVV